MKNLKIKFSKSSFFVCVSIFIFSVYCCLALAACGNTNIKDFIADEAHCVVSLPQEYSLVYEDEGKKDVSMSDINLNNSETVNGKPKTDGFIYYNLLKNEPFRIVTPFGITDDKRGTGQTLVYWKLNGKLYKDGDNYYSANVFTCAKDAVIEPVYCEFRPVGILLYEDKQDNLSGVRSEELFDGDGMIKEQEGVYYLYGVYDFEPDQNFWRTNLTVNSFKKNLSVKAVSENSIEKFYTIEVEIDKADIFKKDYLAVEMLYKIDGHGYMVYNVGGTREFISADAAVNITRTVSIGKHVLKYTFV